MTLIAATYGLTRFGYGLLLPRFTDTFQRAPVISGFIGPSPSKVSCGSTPPGNSDERERQPPLGRAVRAALSALSPQYIDKQSDRADRDTDAAEAGSGTSAPRKTKGQS